MDRFQLLPSGEIRINDRAFIDIVRDAELPAATAEYEQRVADGEPADEIYNLAGDYHHLTPSMLFLPKRNLLDEPDSLASGFALPDDDIRLRKATVLGCTCGVWECWFLLVLVTLTDSTVRWSDFQQFHRDWEYDLEFSFDRTAYENQLTPPGA